MDAVPPMDSPEATEAAFYAAFRAGDLAAMMALWDDAPDVACVHPTAPLLAGRAAIEESWRHIFSVAAGGVDISPWLRSAHASGDLAVHLVEERLGESGLAIATNIYRLGPSGWRMVMHHASAGGERSVPRTAQVH